MLRVTSVPHSIPAPAAVSFLVTAVQLGDFVIPGLSKSSCQIHSKTKGKTLIFYIILVYCIFIYACIFYIILVLKYKFVFQNVRVRQRQERALKE